MNTLNNGISRALYVFGTLILVSSGHASILLDDTFANGNRTTQNLPTSAHWFSGGTTARANVTGGRLVFSGAPSGDIGGGGLAYFTATGSPEVLQLGQSITLSFDYSFGTTDTKDWSFGFGLFNSGGSRVTVDNTGFNAGIFKNYVGYEVAGIFGTDTSSGRYKIAQRTGAANNLLSTSTYTVLGSGIKQTGGITPGVTYSASLIITYVNPTNIVIESMIDGQALFRTNTTGLITSFDTVGIFASDKPDSLTIDNILVDPYFVPEPSIISFIALGFLLFTWSRAQRR